MADKEAPKAPKQKTLDPEVEKKLLGSATGIYNLGVKHGKESQKKLAKSETAKRLGKIAESVAAKAEAQKINIDDKKVKTACNKIVMGGDISYADANSLAVTVLSRLATLPAPAPKPKAPKAKKE